LALNAFKKGFNDLKMALPPKKFKNGFEPQKRLSIPSVKNIFAFHFCQKNLEKKLEKI